MPTSSPRHPTRKTAAKKTARPATPKPTQASPRKATAKAPAAKKTPAKKTSAKTPAKKTPAKRTSTTKTSAKTPTTKQAARVSDATSGKAAGKASKGAAELLEVSFATPPQWEAWLAEHHATTPGVWLKFAKKSSGLPSITYAEALDGALIWGWIDGQVRRLDERHWLQRYTPRTARSIWSKVNRDKALALIESGRMQPPGRAEVDRAQNDGRWDAAYDSPSKAAVPDDLAAALAANPRAADFFSTLDSRNRYAILHRLQVARKPETRARNLVRFVEMLARHEKLHP